MNVAEFFARVQVARENSLRDIPQSDFEPQVSEESCCDSLQWKTDLGTNRELINSVEQHKGDGPRNDKETARMFQEQASFQPRDEDCCVVSGQWTTHGAPPSERCAR